jgi:endonuclease I
LRAQTAYDPPTGLYATANGLAGASLQAALHAAIREHTSITYDQAWEALKILDQDPANSANVLLIYSGESRSKNLQENGSNNNAHWNREHTWPRSLGDFATGDVPGSDLHHLFPCDTDVNATRGNLPFDTVAPGGSAVAEAPLSRVSGTAFEPRDADKGQLARAQFYMAVRYEPNDDVLDVGDLILGETASTTQRRMARLSTLLAWHRRFPATEAERRRNHRVDTLYQGNRNPFVDHPYYADLVFASATASTPRAAWRLHRFSSTQLADAAVSGELADPDRDALPNLLEYTLGSDPLRSDLAPLTVSALLPPATPGAGPRLRLTHRRHRFAEDLDLVYQHSSDLGNPAAWKNVTPSLVSRTRTADNLHETLVLDLTLGSASAPAGFVRLRATVRP